MNPISLIKLLTLASFFVLGIQFKAHAESKEECQVKNNKLAKAECTPAKIAAHQALNKLASPQAFSECVLTKTAEFETVNVCDALTSKADKDRDEAKCDAALAKYDTAMKDTDAECERLGGGTSAECRKKAKECRSGLTGGLDSPDGESAVDSITSLINVFAKTQNAEAPSAVEGCVTDDEDAAKKEEERVDDKITRLREEIQDIQEKAVAADKELADKKQDVEEKMLDVEKDAEKEKFQKLTKNQEDAGRMQKSIMNSEKKRRDNILRIADKNIEIANFTFAHQKLNLALSDSRITKECRDKSIAAMNLKVKGSLDPKSGKEIRPKFTQRESMQFKKDLKQEESNCILERALQRTETTKALVDQKRKVIVEIDSLNASNVDEEKAIATEIKQMDALKAIATEEEAKAIEAKNKKLTSLNKTVTDMEKYVTDKKKTYDEKTKAKNDLIDELQLKRQKVKPKFKKVISTVQSSGRAASTFLNMCCNFRDAKDNHTDCDRVTTDEPEGITAKTKIGKPATKK